jgi:hypothetical protein
VVHYVSVFLSMALQSFVGPWPLFFSFLIFYAVGMTPWAGTQPFARPLAAHRTAQTQWMHRDIHASSGIRTHDPSVWAGEDSSCLRPPGHCDRLHHVCSTLKCPCFLVIFINSQSSHDIILCTFRVLENGVPRRMLRPKKEKVTGCWRYVITGASWSALFIMYY